MRRLTTFLKTDIGIALILAICWQLTMTLLGFILAPHQGLLGHMLHWDAGWYQHIIQYGYSEQGSPAAPAFYPLMPLLIGGLHTLSFGLIPLEVASLFINTTALWAALVFLWEILKHFKLSRRAQYSGIALFLAFPSAFFMHAFYSEAIFIAIGFGAYYFALTRKWWLVGTLLAVLTAARLPSLLFVALCGLEFMNTYKWNVKKFLNKQLFWFLLAPLGLLAYALYLFITRGDALAMFHAYSATTDWTYQQFNLNIFASLFETTQKVITSLIGGGFNYEIFINYALPLLSLALIIWASAYCLIVYKNRGIPLAVFGLLSVVLFTLNSNVVSVHRYALACLVIFVAVALLVQRHKKLSWAIAIVVAASFCVQGFLYWKFIQDIFAG